MKVARRKLASNVGISFLADEEVEAIAVVLLATVLLPLYEKCKIRKKCFTHKECHANTCKMKVLDANMNLPCCHVDAIVVTCRVTKQL